MKSKGQELKEKQVEELKEKIENSRAFVITGIKSLGAANYQAIRKQIRDKADIKVYKKNIMLKAIDKIEKGAIKHLKPYIKEDIALMFSKIDPFELSVMLGESKTPAKAKPGQIAPEDIEVKEGPTDLMPGPAISQLGDLGIPIAVEEGKIVIKKDKVIAKEGEKISEGAADVMSKLDIKPFEIGFEPLAAYDVKENKFYENIEIDKEKILDSLKNSGARAVAFAFSIGYICEETINPILGKIKAEADTLSKIIDEKATVKEEVKQEKAGTLESGQEAGKELKDVEEKAKKDVSKDEESNEGEKQEKKKEEKSDAQKNKSREEN